jgi:hypothetical protein
MGKFNMKSIVGASKVALLVAAVFAIFSVQPFPAYAAGPTLQSAVIEAYSGRTIRLSFDDISGGGQPLRTDFTVTGSVQGNIVVSAVFKSGNFFRITTSSVAMAGQTITLTYVPSTNVPTNSAGEPLAGFTTPLDNPGARITNSFQSISVISSNLSQLRLAGNTDEGTGVTSTCAVTSQNFAVKVNGSARQISSVVQTCNLDYITINLASPIVANDVVTVSYIPSDGSIVSIFGTPASAFSDVRVGGVPDTIAPTILLPTIANYQFGVGGTISLTSNEEAYWQVSTDRTLSFQIAGTPPQLLVSSILPVGTYTVGVSASDNAGNVTTRNITVNITALAPSPTPTPIAIPKPTATTPVPPKSTVYKTCQLLNKKYPGGVATSYAARNKGTGMNYIPRVDSAVYKANIKLDKDKDGIACER